MKAFIEGIEVKDVTIVGKWEGAGVMVEWTCPAKNVNPFRLLKINHAGFQFHILDGVCHVTSRLICTQFAEY